VGKRVKPLFSVRGAGRRSGGASSIKATSKPGCVGAWNDRTSKNKSGLVRNPMVETGRETTQSVNRLPNATTERRKGRKGLDTRPEELHRNLLEVVVGRICSKGKEPSLKGHPSKIPSRCTGGSRVGAQK